MASGPGHEEIDRLYQLPLDEFTAARNALAKRSPVSAEIRALQKPPVAAWAINQVYWRARPAFHALAAATAALRDAHTATMTGKSADLREAGKAHEAALEAVEKTAAAILKDAGQPATDATRQAIAMTLRALPGSTDSPGRLTRLLQPSGFELLAGLPASLTAGTRAAPAAAPKAPKPSPARPRDAAKERALAKAKEAVAAAERAERTAEQNARREEFEAARTLRDAERADGALAKAREALEAAQDAVTTAERDSAVAAKKKQSAERRVKETGEALAAAQVRTETARATLDDD